MEQLTLRISQTKSQVKNYTNQLLKKVEKGRLHSPFIDNIQGADFCDMQLMSKFYKGFRFLLCVINTFSKYAWVMPLKDKREITITNPFQKKFK